MVRSALSEAAPYLGVILPAIAAFFMYRRTEASREKVLQEAKNAMPTSVAGAIMSQENAKLYVEEAQRAIHALDRVAEAASALTRALADSNVRDREMVNEVAKIGRVLEEISGRLKK